MKVSTEKDNNVGDEKIAILGDNMPLKAYRLSELIFFVYIKSYQYSMFYTNKMF
jgi:hypothetical protein